MDAVARVVDRGEPGRVVRALHTVTGDAGLLRTALAAELASGGYGTREAIHTSGELGPEAAALRPAPRAALSDPGSLRALPQLDDDSEIPLALWRITGASAAAVRILDGVFAGSDGPWFHWTGVRSARAAALPGPAAGPLRPRLEHLVAASLCTPPPRFSRYSPSRPKRLPPTPSTARPSPDSCRLPPRRTPTPAPPSKRCRRSAGRR
ncbi:hypothetical protein GCM10010211_27300 [Streptomyces albospinus]|uniref:Uncharacterized protein n=1 Tax=Streptomyces albospinus TaxID=285515 RepID=A0ABQ2UZT7_9ACTN|nr:hypothetical protein GCM10010211_27300 [Streptomyces albospinus]